MSTTEARQREKERLAQALRDGDMATFTAAVRKANRPLRLACQILMHCNKGRNHDGPCHVPGAFR